MKSITDLNLKNKTVLLRLNLNVPIKDGKILDDFRIQAILPTLEYCFTNAKRTMIIAHLGRPTKRDQQHSLQPIADHLHALTNYPIVFVDDCVGKPVEEALANAPHNSILLLENLRFHKGELENDEDFGRALCEYADVYINDAFGDSAKETASITWPAQLLPHGIGFQFHEELKHLRHIAYEPRIPFVVVIGGAKIKEKLGVIEKLGQRADKILLGGGVANTFLKAQGIDTKDSLIQEDEVNLAHDIIDHYYHKIIFPLDVVVAKKENGSYDESTIRDIPIEDLEEHDAILDLGIQTFEHFQDVISRASTVFWSGPLGYIEWEPTAQSSIKMARMIAGYAMDTFIGGGETASVLDLAGVDEHEIDFVSTGGSASLQFLSGVDLPGLKFLR